MEKLIQIVESAIGYFNYKQNKSVLQLLFCSLLHHAIHIVRKCLDTYFQYTDFFSNVNHKIPAISNWDNKGKGQNTLPYAR